MGPLDLARRFPSCARHGATLLTAAALVVAAACSDQPPVAPRQLAPGTAALSLSPSFAALPTGGPSIPLSKLRAVLTAPNGDHLDLEVAFHGDSAVLSFDNVPIAGASVAFTLTLTAFDLQGAVAYTSQQQITLHPGDNPMPQPPVLVYDGPDAKVTALHITPTTLTLPALGSTTLGVTGTNASGQLVPSLRVGWTSSDPTIATVDATGAVKAGQSQGSTTIVARAANDSSAAITLKVQAPVDRVVITATSLSLARGKTSAVVAELRDVTNHLIDDRTITWTSSDPTVGTVSATGVVTAAKIGKTTITAQSEGKTATLPVTVTTSVDHIELLPAALQFSSLKQSIPLVTKVVPVSGGSLDGIVTRFTSATPTVATVDSNGVVTAISNGLAKITANVDGVTATVDATVAQVAVAVAVSPRAASASTLTQKTTFTTNAVDANANRIDAPKVLWKSADTTIGTVAGTGATAIVTPHGIGITQISATVDGKTDVSTFVVAPLTSMLILSASSTQVAIGQSVTLFARYGDADGNPLGDATATFTTSTPGLVSIQGKTLTGVAPGVAQIVATSGQYTASLALPVGVAGPEMVVFGDAGFMGDGAVEFIGASQLQFLDNLFANPSGGARAQNSSVLLYRGHASVCATITGFCGPNSIGLLRDHMSQLERNLFDTTDVSGTALSSGLDPKVSVLVLMMPTTPFNSAEIAGLKQFAVEGGRIVFMGGRVEDYGNFLDVENAFLAAMGSSIVANPDDQWCDKAALTGASLKTNQLTAGVTQLSFGCASSMSLGANGTAVLLDGTQTFVLGAVTNIDVTGAGVQQKKRPAAKPTAVRRP